MKFIYYFTLSALLVACGNKEQVVAEENTGENLMESIQLGPLAGEHDYDAIIEKIDASLEDLSRVESLIYTKEDASTMSVVAHLDANDKIVRIEEIGVDGPRGVKTVFHFYLKDGHMYASHRTTIKGVGENAYFSEEYIYYNDKGEIVFGKERVSNLEETIEQASFHKAKLEKHSSENAFEVLQQRGHYAITFQGFNEYNGYHFLVVGENVLENGYTSSLVIQEDSNTLRYLRGEGSKALGKELQVEYVRMVDQLGYNVCILQSVALVQRK